MIMDHNQCNLVIAKKDYDLFERSGAANECVYITIESKILGRRILTAYVTSVEHSAMDVPTTTATLTIVVERPTE